MRSRIASLAAAVLALPALLHAAPGEPAESYGEPLRLETTTPIAEIVADPDRYEGERVRVAGEIEGVCPMKGCWMNLRQDDAVVRVQVEDDVVVFPGDAVGAEAVAEGVVEVEELDRERYVAWQRHLAEELDRPFDPATIGDGPFTLVTLRGLGAEIERR